MARNEDGEFELMLGNKQLLSVFFLMVLLLCLCFVGGYLLGRSAAPVLSAVNEPPSQSSTSPTSSAPPPVVDPVPSTPAPTETAKNDAPPPVRTAPQVSTEKAEPPKPAPVKPAPVKPVETKSTAKATPAKAPPPTKTAPVKQVASGQPIAGKTYLQLSATDKDKADLMVDLLHSKKLPGMAAAIAERPGLYRVLVGPLSDSAINDMRAQLRAGGFAGDQAIKRVF